MGISILDMFIAQINIPVKLISGWHSCNLKFCINYYRPKQNSNNEDQKLSKHSGDLNTDHLNTGIQFIFPSIFSNETMTYSRIIGDHSKQWSVWIIGTSLTLSSTKQGTFLGTLVVLFNPFTRYIYSSGGKQRWKARKWPNGDYLRNF